MQPSQEIDAKLPARNNWFEKSLRLIRNLDLPENSKEHLDERLDEGLEETFPSSDPVSVIITRGVAPGSTQFLKQARGAGGK
jgi:hypothetical protein